MDVVEIIKKVFNLPDDKITDDLSYQSIPEWDSLNHVSLVIALEEAYGITIDDELMLQLTSVGEIKKVFGNLKNDKLTREEKKSDENDRNKVFRGLNNIMFDNTSITNMDGKKGILEIRGYSIDDLVNNAAFEEVVYLLLFKKLPNNKELEEFNIKLKACRNIPTNIKNLIYTMKDASPTVVLRTAVSMIADYDTNIQDNSIEANIKRSIYLISKVPTILATHYRYRNNLVPVEPSKTLSHAANILYMLYGKEPTAKQIDIINKILIIHSEHGSNASTFTARIVVGTKSDIYGAITAAISTFAGPLHGGAIEQTMKMLREIKTAENVHLYVKEKRERNEAIMGFGHRVYRVEDPRAKHLRKILIELSEELNKKEWLNIANALKAEMSQYDKHGVSINVDFYASVIYNLLDFPDDIFVPMFILGRISGWSANVIEQLENNILIRPIMNYVGEKTREYNVR